MNSDYLLDVYKRVTQAHHEQMGYPPLKATLGEREPQAGPQPPRRPHRVPSRSPNAAHIDLATVAIWAAALAISLLAWVGLYTLIWALTGWKP